MLSEFAQAQAEKMQAECAKQARKIELGDSLGILYLEERSRARNALRRAIDQETVPAKETLSSPECFTGRQKMTIREVADRLEALRKELGGGWVFQSVGKHNTRLEFTIVLPNDQSIEGIRLPESPPESDNAR